MSVVKIIKRKDKYYLLDNKYQVEAGPFSTRQEARLTMRRLNKKSAFEELPRHTEEDYIDTELTHGQRNADPGTRQETPGFQWFDYTPKDEYGRRKKNRHTPELTEALWFDPKNITTTEHNTTGFDTCWRPSDDHMSKYEELGDAGVC